MCFTIFLRILVEHHFDEYHYLSVHTAVKMSSNNHVVNSKGINNKRLGGVQQPTAAEATGAAGRASSSSAFISRTTSSISMTLSSSSKKSLGGRLGPLQVSRPHRHTVACKRKKEEYFWWTKKLWIDHCFGSRIRLDPVIFPRFQIRFWKFTESGLKTAVYNEENRIQIRQ